MKLPILNTILLIAILCYLVIGTIDTGRDQKQVYVVTSELFNEFDYQKELDLEYKTIQEAKMSELELLKQDVINLEQKVRSEIANQEDRNAYEYRYKQFVEMEASINQELANLNNNYSLQIWEKINALTSQYGEEQNFEVIFGAGGNGNIMYAQEKKNITEELIAFCNLKYNGK